MDERLVRVVRLIADEPPRHDDGDGVAGMLRRLCSAAGRALSSGTGVSVLAGGEMRGVAAVSEPEYEPVEDLQFTLGEGPCLDAFASRQPVLVPDLSDGAIGRWPGTLLRCTTGVYGAVLAFPLEIGAARLEAFDVFRYKPGSLTAREFRDAMTFADVAVTTLLDGQARAAPGAAAAASPDRRRSGIRRRAVNRGDHRFRRTAGDVVRRRG